MSEVDADEEYEAFFGEKRGPICVTVWPGPVHGIEYDNVPSIIKVRFGPVRSDIEYQDFDGTWRTYAPNPPPKPA